MDDYDDDSSESLSKLPWLWVIEALAGFKGITISTLQGLIDVAPVGPGDFCENTRELVSMKCLEKLHAQGVNLDAPSSSTLDSRVGLDFSHTCEHVLQEIWHEVPLSKPKTAGTEILKWDLYPFILHKKTGTVKCQLEQLKESILGGTLPLTDELKARSGLFQRKRNHIVHVNDGEGDDHPGKDDGKTSCAENTRAKENLVSLILKDKNKPSEECLPDNILLSSKRSRVHSDDEHYTRYLHEKQVCSNEYDDFLRIKKVKLYASTNFDSKKEKLVSQLGKKVSDSSTEKNLIISEKGGHHTENNNMEILRDGPLEDSPGNCSASNLCQSSSHTEFFHNESITPFNATLMPQHTFEGESSRQQQVKSIVALPRGTQQKTPGGKPLSNNETDLQLEDSHGLQLTVGVDKAKDDTGNSYGVEVSGEKIDLIMKKHEEQNHDMKCNEGDPQHTSGVEPCHDTSMDERNDAVLVEPIPTNDGTSANKIQHMTNESQHKLNEPIGASLNASQKPVASDKAVVDTVNGCGAELSSDSESDGYHKEKNDLGSKKDEFLSSERTFGREPSAMSESTGQIFCMKCNEAGQLLACKTTTCSLMVHRNCLDASAQVDEKGNFFCPFCAYSHTISEYLEAKKQASLARKELAIFINKGIRKQAAEHVEKFSRQDHSLSRKNHEYEHIHLKNNKNDPLTGKKENRKDHAGEHANEVNNFRFERNQQQAPIPIVHSLGRDKEDINKELVDNVRKEDDGETSNAKSLTGGRIEDKEVQTDHVGGHDNEKFSRKRANIVPASESNAGQEVSQNMTEQNMNGTVEPVSARDTGKEEISEDECKQHIISKDSSRIPTHELQHKTPASPQLKGKAIPWTDEEEGLLKKIWQMVGLTHMQTLQDLKPAKENNVVMSNMPYAHIPC